jgi:hypothetical protein
MELAGLIRMNYKLQGTSRHEACWVFDLINGGKPRHGHNEHIEYGPQWAQ